MFLVQSRINHNFLLVKPDAFLLKKNLPILLKSNIFETQGIGDVLLKYIVPYWDFIGRNSAGFLKDIHLHIVHQREGIGIFSAQRYVAAHKTQYSFGLEGWRA